MILVNHSLFLVALFPVYSQYFHDIDAVLYPLQDRIDKDITLKDDTSIRNRTMD